MEALLNGITFGWSIDYRPSEPNWPAPYRCRILPNKQERQEWRVTGYGPGVREAFEDALAQCPDA